jgi:hypothetical protein
VVKSGYLLGLAALLASRAAMACPSCATRGSGGLMVPILLAGMILTPYLVTTVVLRIVRQAEAERAQEEKAAGEPQGTPNDASDLANA